jgi:hypothetical protein
MDRADDGRSYSFYTYAYDDDADGNLISSLVIIIIFPSPICPPYPVAAEVVSNALLNESWQRLWSDDESCSWEDALRQLSAELYRWWQVRSRLLYLWMYTAYVHYVNGKGSNSLRTAVAA